MTQLIFLSFFGGPIGLFVLRTEYT